MRIAFINQPRDFMVASAAQRGSVSLVAWELARRLAARHEITVYAPCAPGQLFEERSVGNLTIRRTPRAWRTLHRAIDLGTGWLGTHPPYFTRRAYFEEYAVAVGALLKRDPPHIVHLQCASQFVPVLRRAVPDARIVLHVHDDFLTRVDRARIESRLALAHAVVTCSDYITRRWRERFPSYAHMIWTIGNGVDLDLFHPPAAERAPAHEILFVGRVSPEKGVHVLADAFERVSQELPDARLTIVGAPGLLPSSHLFLLAEDEHIAALREFYGHGPIEKLRLQVLHARHGYLDAVLSRLSARTRARVHVAGFQEYTCVPEFYRRANVLAMPSAMPEPFGLPAVEALASGMPVVATRAGGVAGIIEDGMTGRLVERGDVGGLARALCEILTNERVAAGMGRAARAAAAERFGWQHPVARLDDVYARVTVRPLATTPSPRPLVMAPSDRV